MASTKSPLPRRGPNETHKAHFVCFDCRKGFKQRGTTYEGGKPIRVSACPDCGKPMTHLGRYFKRPRTDATQQWLKVELLHSYGETFMSGNKRLGEECKTLSQAIAYTVKCSNTLTEADVKRRLAAIRKTHAWSRK